MSKILSAIYYQENEERLQKKARKRYQNLSKEEREKKRQYGCEHYKNISKDGKQKLVEYTEKYYRMRKNPHHKEVMTQNVPLKVHVERDKKL